MIAKDVKNDLTVSPSSKFQLKALKRARGSGDEKEWKWMLNLQKRVVSATAMNEDVGESVGGGGGAGCYLLRASSLELDSLGGATMKAKVSSNWVDCQCNLDQGGCKRAKKGIPRWPTIKKFFS